MKTLTLKYRVLLVVIVHVNTYPKAKVYTDGINTILIDAERENPNLKIGHTKVRENANKTIAQKHVFEALLVNHEGFVTEGSRSNVFFIKDRKFYTAPDSLVLLGIMRSKVIELIKELQFELIDECIHTSLLPQMNAAFITGTSSRILPIKNIDDLYLDVNNDCMRKLMSRLQQYIDLSKK